MNFMYLYKVFSSISSIPAKNQICQILKKKKRSYCQILQYAINISGTKVKRLRSRSSRFDFVRGYARMEPEEISQDIN
jgi:hypothetical protein